VHASAVGTQWRNPQGAATQTRKPSRSTKGAPAVAASLSLVPGAASRRAPRATRFASPCTTTFKAHTLGGIRHFTYARELLGVNLVDESRTAGAEEMGAGEEQPVLSPHWVPTTHVLQSILLSMNLGKVGHLEGRLSKRSFAVEVAPLPWTCPEALLADPSTLNGWLCDASVG
jgi:hypothetical protein